MAELVDELLPDILKELHTLAKGGNWRVGRVVTASEADSHSYPYFASVHDGTMERVARSDQSITEAASSLIVALKTKNFG